MTRFLLHLLGDKETSHGHEYNSVTISPPGMFVLFPWHDAESCSIQGLLFFLAAVSYFTWTLKSQACARCCGDFILARVRGSLENTLCIGEIKHYIAVSNLSSPLGPGCSWNIEWSEELWRTHFGFSNHCCLFQGLCARSAAPEQQVSVGHSNSHCAWHKCLAQAEWVRGSTHQPELLPDTLPTFGWLCSLVSLQSVNRPS